MAFRTGSQRAQIYNTISAMGKLGMTADEAEQDLKIRHASCSACFTWLHQNGYIVPTINRRRTETGRKAVVYVISELGE